MKTFLLLVGVFGLFSSFGSAAEVLNTENNKLQLQEISVDATETFVNKPIHCSKSEIAAGVLNLFSFSREKDNSLRELVPTYRPLDNEAAWFIHNQACPDLLPYLNGLGFDTYDAATGLAVIYLAAFQPKAIDSEKWAANKDNAYGRMQQFFQPDFAVTNILRFPAKCEVKRPAGWKRANHMETELVCTFTGQTQGTIRFAVHPN
jgi:hypothetical protein